jgi:hypothetical protein
VFDPEEYHCIAERRQAWANLDLHMPVPVSEMKLSWAGLRALGQAQLEAAGE